MEERKERYSDAELEEFRTLINMKIARAEKELEELVGSAVDNSISEDEAAITNSTDAGVDYAQKAEIKRLADRQILFIQKLRSALNRINNKTYGICRVTGKLIPKERLRAVPHATLSMEAKNR